MTLSAEEKLMYRVMKAIYDSGIPISFKGSMVMKACLMEAGFIDDTRHTEDIDGNWYFDTLPTSHEMHFVSFCLTSRGILFMPPMLRL